MVTGADMELDGTHLATTEKAKQMLKELKFQREALDKMDGTIVDGLQGAEDGAGRVASDATAGADQGRDPRRSSQCDIRGGYAGQEWYVTLDERVTALVRQLDEKVLAFSKQLAEAVKQLAEAVKQLKVREDDCDSLRAAGSRLQARTGQLEARLDTEIEQQNHELTGLEGAVSAMRTVESRCIEKTPKPNGCRIRETPGVQHEGVAKIRQFAQHGSARRALRPKSDVEIKTESSLLWFPTAHRDE